MPDERPHQIHLTTTRQEPDPFERSLEKGPVITYNDVSDQAPEFCFIRQMVIRPKQYSMFFKHKNSPDHIAAAPAIQTPLLSGNRGPWPSTQVLTGDASMDVDGVMVESSMPSPPRCESSQEDPFGSCPFVTCRQHGRAKPWKAQSLMTHLVEYHRDEITEVPRETREALRKIDRAWCECCRQFKSTKRRHPCGCDQGPHKASGEPRNVIVEEEEKTPVGPVRGPVDVDATWDQLLKLKLRTLAEIPRHLMGITIKCLTFAIERTLHLNTEREWFELLALPLYLLRVVVDEGDRRCTLNKEVHRRADIYLKEGFLNLESLMQSRGPEHTPHDPVRTARFWVAKGRPGKALQALESTGLAPVSDRTEDLLRAKHPTSEEDPVAAPLPSDPHFPHISDEMVEDALRSFDRYTGAGPSKLRAGWLQDLVESDVSGKLLAVLSRLLERLVNGEVPRKIARILSSASLTGLNKKDDLDDGLPDVRPIAVGEVLRRLGSKLACNLVIPRIAKDHFFPLQTGVGMSCGTEIVSHAVRSILKEHPDWVLLQVDFQNAFNMVSRAHFFREIRSLAPELYRWCHLMYGHEPALFWEHVAFASSTGVQQGDPLGPALFSLVLQPLVLRIQSLLESFELGVKPLNAWFLDDGNIATPIDLVEPVLDLLVANESTAAGLHLSLKKTKLIGNAHGRSIRTDQDGKQWISIGPYELAYASDGAVVLGAPVGTPEFTHRFADKILDKMERVHEQIMRLEDPHMETYLFKFCSGFCRVNYLLRTTPPDLLTEFLVRYRRVCCTFLGHLLGLPEVPNLPLQQASLRPSMGGLGLRLDNMQALAAYTASRLSCAKRVLQLSGSQLNTQPDVETLRGVSSSLFPSDARLLEMPHRVQHLLASALDEARQAHILAQCCERDKVRLFGISAKHASSWLVCTPNRKDHMQPADFQIALRNWFGIGIFPADGVRCGCGGYVNTYGDHCTGCQTGGGLVHGHDIVVSTIADLLRMGGRTIEIEKGGHIPGKSRIADIAVHYGPHEHALDITITSSVTLNRSSTVSLVRGAVALVGHNAKVSKRSAVRNACGQLEIPVTGGTLLFTPLAFDHFGGMTPDTEQFLRSVARDLSTSVGMKYPPAVAYVMRRVAMAVQRRHVRCMAAVRSRLRQEVPDADLIVSDAGAPAGWD